MADRNDVLVAYRLPVSLILLAVALRVFGLTLDQVVTLVQSLGGP